MPLHPTRHTTSHKHRSGTAAPVTITCPAFIPLLSPFFLSFPLENYLPPRYGQLFQRGLAPLPDSMLAHDLGWTNQHNPFAWHNDWYVIVTWPKLGQWDSAWYFCKYNYTKDVSCLFPCWLLGLASFTSHLVTTRGRVAQEVSNADKAGLRDTETVAEA